MKNNYPENMHELADRMKAVGLEPIGMAAAKEKIQKHLNDNAKPEKDAARKTAEYWKAEHLAGNAIIESLRAELAELNESYDSERIRLMRERDERNAQRIDAENQLAELRARSTHCENCGCDWLDNGLNPVGCPYCKRNEDKFNPCLNSLVRQVALMMDDCEEHADGSITIDCDISQGFLRRIYDLLNALEDAGYDAIEPQPAVPDDVAKDAERYRFIRDRAVTGAVQTQLPLYRVHHWHNYEPVTEHPHIDDAIDAAILAAKEKGQ